MAGAEGDMGNFGAMMLCASLAACAAALRDSGMSEAEVAQLVAAGKQQCAAEFPISSRH